MTRNWSHQAIACDLMLSDEMTKRAYELTGLENPNSVSQLKGVLEEKGIPIDKSGEKRMWRAMIKELDQNGCDPGGRWICCGSALQMAKSSGEKVPSRRAVCQRRRQGQRAVPILRSKSHRAVLSDW